MDPDFPNDFRMDGFPWFMAGVKLILIDISVLVAGLLLLLLKSEKKYRFYLRRSMALVYSALIGIFITGIMFFQFVNRSINIYPNRYFYSMLLLLVACSCFFSWRIQISRTKAVTK